MKLHAIRVFTNDMVKSVRDMIHSQSSYLKLFMTATLIATSVSMTAADTADTKLELQAGISAEELDLMLNERGIGWNQPPVFVGPLHCINGIMFADFADPDGPDNQVSVIRIAVTPGQGSGFSHSRMGILEFFGDDYFAAPLTPGAVHYVLRGVDIEGGASEWVAFDGGCNPL